MVNREEPLSIRCQCNLVSVSRGSFYYKPLGESEDNLKLMRLMDEHYLELMVRGPDLAGRAIFSPFFNRPLDVRKSGRREGE